MDETGWKKLNGSWDYLKSSGAMATYLKISLTVDQLGFLRNMWERIAIHIIMFNCLVVNGSREKNQTIYQKLSLFGSFFF